MPQPQRGRDGGWQVRIDERNRMRNHRAGRNSRTRPGWNDRPPLRIEARVMEPKQEGLRGGLVDVKKEQPVALSGGLRRDRDEVHQPDYPLRGRK